MRNPKPLSMFAGLRLKSIQLKCKALWMNVKTVTKTNTRLKSNESFTLAVFFFFLTETYKCFNVVCVNESIIPLITVY